MSDRQRSVSVTPETDDFGSRYDRMAEKGSGSWAVKALVGLAALVAALIVIANLLG